MPDKSTQDWQADEQFWSEAWTDMEQRLDRAEQPSKRRIGWWWLVGAFVLIGLVLAIVIPRSFGQDPGPEDQFAPAPNAVVNASEIVAKAAKSTDLDVPPVKSNFTENPTLKESQTVKQSSIAIPTKPASEPITLTPEVAQKSATIARTNNGPAPDPSSNLSREVDKVSSEVPEDQSMEARNTEVGIDVLERRVFTPLLANDGDEKAPFSSTTLKKLATAVSFGSFAPRYRFFAEAALSHGNQRPGIGYGISAGLQRGLTPRSSLSASLGYLVLRERLRNGTGGSSSDEFSVPVPGNDTMPGTQELTALAVNELIASGNNYLSTEYLRFGLDFGHRLGNRWAISGGVGINYLLAARGPVVDFSQPSGNRGNNFVDLLNQTSSSFSAAAGANSGDLDQSFTDLQRFRYDFQLGADYTFNRHLSVGLGARYLATSLLNESVTTDRFRTHVRLRYSF